MPGVFRRALAVFRRSRIDRDLREELEGHVDLRRRQLIEDGMDPEAARREAARMFGNVTALREASRDAWAFPRFESLLQDVRFGLRLLAQTPLFTSVAVLSLAVGIGAAVAIFNIADAVLFRPLPVRAPQELRAFRIEMRMGAASKKVFGVPEPALASVQQGADFADYIGFRTVDDVALDAGAGATSRLVRIELVSPRYFDTLGVIPVIGRFFLAHEDASARAAVLSERLWRSAFNADPSVLGRTVTLNGHPVTVTGIAREFRGLMVDRQVDVFVPLAATGAVHPPSAQMPVMLVGRLRPGVTTAEAEQKHAALYRVAMPSLGKEIELHPQLLDASRGVAETREEFERPVTLGLWLAAVLVLVACANTGALMLARFVSRRGEFGVRVAIGAGRARLARQLSIEALLVALLAAGAGLLIGWLAAPLLLRLMPHTETAAAFELRFDTRLVAFTIVLAVACAAGAVSASLFRLWRSDATSLLSAESRATVEGSRRVTRGLIAAQVACSLLLGVGAISMARTLLNLRHVALGFDPQRTFVVDVNAAGLVDERTAAAYHGALHDRIAALPGVERSTMAQIGILTTAATVGTVDVDGFTPVTDEDRIARMFFIGPDYFETLGIPVIAGRTLSEQDTTGRQQVAVVNERFATFYFGSAANAVDRLVNGDVRIIGVVADTRYTSLRAEIWRTMFVTYRPVQRARMVHIIRAAGDRAAVMTAVGSAVRDHDGRIRPRLATGENLVAAAVARETFFAAIAIVLAALAITLACAGVYAAVAYAVSRRRAEFAVRMALGASAGDVMRLVLKDPLVTTLAGAAAGIPGAYLVLRSASSLLFEVSSFDPRTVVICTLALVTCALLAAVSPARRAARIDPVAALRN